MDTKGFRKRFEDLGDIRELLEVAAPKYRDPEVYFKELIENEPNVALAEKRLIVLEDLLVRSEEERIQKSLERLVRERNELLRESDWSQLPDVPLSQDEKKLYRKYREYLRELPNDVKSGKLPTEVKNFADWKKWVEDIRYIPGFKKYVP